MIGDVVHSSGPRRRRDRCRCFHTSRSTRAFGVLVAAGVFVGFQWVAFEGASQAGVVDGLFGAVASGALVWFIWRCGPSAGVHLGSGELRVEQLLHSWVLSRDRVVEVRTPRGLTIRTPRRTISVMALSGSLIADWTGNTSVRRAGAAVREWTETAPVSGDGGVERVSVRHALLHLSVAELAMVGTYALGQLAVAFGVL